MLWTDARRHARVRVKSSSIAQGERQALRRRLHALVGVQSLRDEHDRGVLALGAPFRLRGRWRNLRGAWQP